MMFDTKAFAVKNKSDFIQHIITKIACSVMQIETHRHGVKMQDILKRVWSFFSRLLIKIQRNNSFLNLTPRWGLHVKVTTLFSSFMAPSSGKFILKHPLCTTAGFQSGQPI